MIDREEEREAAAAQFDGFVHTSPEVVLEIVGDTPPRYRREGAFRYEVRKMFRFFDPFPFSTFGTDVYYKIHTTSLTASAFP